MASILELPVTPGRSTDLSGPKIGDNLIRFKHVEIEILTACDLSCWGCDRFSDVTNAPNMTVEQVAKFVDESVALEWKWDRIRILGGEPTLHPQLFQIVKELMRYRRFYSKCFLQLLSNGRGKLNTQIPSNYGTGTIREWLTDFGIDPHIEAKDKGVTPAWFANTRIAPIDRDENIGAVEPCGIFGVHGCGIGLTRHGYFLDGAGASVARVSGHDIGVQHLKDVTWQAMLDQAKVLCRLCGHWNPTDGSPLVTELVTKTGEVTGAYWTETLKKFKNQRPTLTVYGDS